MRSLTFILVLSTALTAVPVLSHPTSSSTSGSTNPPTPPLPPAPVLQWHADQQQNCFHTRFTYDAKYPGGIFYVSPDPISDTLNGKYEAWSFRDAANRVCESIQACHSLKWRMLCQVQIAELAYTINLDDQGKANLFDFVVKTRSVAIVPSWKITTMHFFDYWLFSWLAALARIMPKK
ncbi:MAG: hypothetical protein M1816_002449 [Peltula sp. TS41687]|nr:MAG: hypothetical protein M1816_002449 [Peltula sp. TS41687]